jgi:hypothetical protein
MKFSVSLTNQEKKSIFSRAVRDLEKSLLERLILEGIDPDALDENVYEPTPDENGNLISAEVAIKETLDKIARLKAAIAEL